MSQEPKTWVQYDKTLPYIEEREPHLKPEYHLEKDGENSYKVVEGRRPSKMLLINKLRAEVDKWRNEGYPGVTETTNELLNFWFNHDHLIDNKEFHYWFCQREAIETLIYLFEYKKYNDLKPVIADYAENFRKDLFKNAVEIVEDLQGNRKVVRYFPELEQEGEQDLPEKGLLRYAFKMATGSGKTYTMALVIVWSYFNHLREREEIAKRYADNFLIVAPNVIVYERLEKDFANNKIFYKLPLIPESWKPFFNLKVTTRGDDSPLSPSGNLIVNNIQQLYESREQEWTPDTIIQDILGKTPQKNLTKYPITLLGKIKQLDNLLVINDEAHHVHDETLQWHKTLMNIHNSLPKGLNLWLDFSATPKNQNGTYYPWIIVDYPLAQAVEDRIVKAPLLVHRVDNRDPEEINENNVVQKYGDWITVALERWKEHYKIYSEVGKKVVLFIMAERNNYADRIAEAIRSQKKNLGLKHPKEEVMVIHVKSKDTGKGETEILDKDLPRLRKLAREIDEPNNKVKIIVSNLMLREGWDVQNVTIVLGLRPFTSKAEILPEQAVGRGLRLMSSISPDHTQTLEIMGTEAFERFVKELEKEGVGVNTTKTPPPLPITIAPERSRLKYDIEIPVTELRYKRNYKKLDSFDPLSVPSLFDSDKLQGMVSQILPPDGRELIAHITNEIMRRARLTCNFNELYPLVEEYLLKKCFEIKIENVDDIRLRKHLSDIVVQDAIVETLSKTIGELTVDTTEVVIPATVLRLSNREPFIWRRKHIRCEKTVFNFVAVYNDFEAEFANFLDKCSDIEKFSALAGFFKIDYLSSRGAVRFYWPDFVAVQKKENEHLYWIIETKGREYEDTDKKDAAIKKWCSDVTNKTEGKWQYLKVMQTEFNSISTDSKSFEDLRTRIYEIRGIQGGLI